MEPCCFTSATRAVCVLALVGLSGCSRGPSNAEIALAKAQVAVEDALNGWVRGEPPEKYACSDPDWKAGSRLLTFLTADAKLISENPDQVRCRVAISVKDRRGKQRDREVSYLVQLGDPVTIRRDDKK